MINICYRYSDIIAHKTLEQFNRLPLTRVLARMGVPDYRRIFGPEWDMPETYPQVFRYFNPTCYDQFKRWLWRQI